MTNVAGLWYLELGEQEVEHVCVARSDCRVESEAAMQVAVGHAFVVIAKGVRHRQEVHHLDEPWAGCSTVKDGLQGMK